MKIAYLFLISSSCFHDMPFGQKSDENELAKMANFSLLAHEKGKMGGKFGKGIFAL